MAVQLCSKCMPLRQCRNSIIQGFGGSKANIIASGCPQAAIPDVVIYRSRAWALSEQPVAFAEAECTALSTFDQEAFQQPWITEPSAQTAMQL